MCVCKRIGKEKKSKVRIRGKNKEKKSNRERRVRKISGKGRAITNDPEFEERIGMLSRYKLEN